MTVSILAAEAADAAGVCALLTEALGPDEAQLVEALRAEGDLLEARVASDDADTSGGPLGYVAVSRLTIAGGRASVLAPLAVRSADRRRGIGGRLVSDVLARRRAAGDDVMLVLGDPAYYRRFGFSAVAASRFQTPWDGPHQQAALLSEAGVSLGGLVQYPRAFSELG